MQLISCRQTRKGDWLVCYVARATYGPGLHQMNSPAPGYTTGAHIARFAAEADAAAHAAVFAADNGCELVEWQYPARNPQFVNLPRKYPQVTRYDTLADADADGWVRINPDKTVHHYKGHVIYARDITPGRSYGYDLAIAVRGHDRVFARSQDLWLSEHPDRGGAGAFVIRFRAGDVVDAIESACRFIDGLVADVR